LGGDFLCGFDGLAGDGCGADRDGVGVDIARGRGLVAVGDGPCGAGEELGGFGFGGGIVGMARAQRSREFGAEYPAVERPLARKVLGMHHIGMKINTYRSAEPVSKSRFRVCPPMVTGVRYSSSLGSDKVSH